MSSLRSSFNRSVILLSTTSFNEQLLEVLRIMALLNPLPLAPSRVRERDRERERVRSQVQSILSILSMLQVLLLLLVLPLLLVWFCLVLMYG